jgi:uncharacterized protein YybS (DUF2232 family)
VNLGVPELLILAVGVVPYGVIIWGLVDAASRPEWAWQRAGQNKALWVVLQVVGLVFCLVGVILSIVYLATIRSQVARQQGPATPPPPYTGPPPG